MQINFYFMPRPNNLKLESLGLKTNGTITVVHFHYFNGLLVWIKRVDRDQLVLSEAS